MLIYGPKIFVKLIFSGFCLFSTFMTIIHYRVGEWARWWAVSQSVKQWVSQSASQSISESVSQLVSESVSESELVSQSVSQSISQTHNQSVSRWVSDWVSQSVSQSLSQTVNQWVSESVSQSVSQPTHRHSSPFQQISYIASERFQRRIGFSRPYSRDFADQHIVKHIFKITRHNNQTLKYKQSRKKFIKFNF